MGAPKARKINGGSAIVTVCGYEGIERIIDLWAGAENVRKGGSTGCGLQRWESSFCGRPEAVCRQRQNRAKRTQVRGVGVEAWLTGADKEQVSQNAASQNGAADAATGAAGGQETDVASDSADSKTKASSGDGTKMDDLTGTIVMTSVQNVLNVRRNRQ